EILAHLALQSSQPTLLHLLRQKMACPPGLLRDMWLTPRGHECARKIAFGNVSYGEYLRLPVILVVYHTLRHGAIPNPSTEQDELLWQAATTFYTAYERGTLGVSQIASLADAWKGDGRRWDNVASSSPEIMEGAVAYVGGRRFLKLEKLEVA